MQYNHRNNASEWLRSQGPPPAEKSSNLFMVPSNMVPLYSLPLALAICFGTFPKYEATISTKFSQFLRKNFGPKAETLIARRDMGEVGSFGGGKWKKRKGIWTKRKKRPVVFVHGLTSFAGELSAVRRQFRELGGYGDADLYATTYACGVDSWQRDSMRCAYVKQIRLFIRAVAQFTRSPQVDVVAYSMGSPIARNAILGGTCVDSGEQLGPPLTHLVYTFLSAGGANNGAGPLCRIFSWTTPCNAVDGMRCHSRFLDDINASSGYEASSRIFTIHSPNDGILGEFDCDGHPISAITGQSGEIVLRDHNHQMVIYSSVEKQIQLLSDG